MGSVGFEPDYNERVGLDKDAKAASDKFEPAKSIHEPCTYTHQPMPPPKAQYIPDVALQ